MQNYSRPGRDFKGCWGNVLTMGFKSGTLWRYSIKVLEMGQEWLQIQQPMERFWHSHTRLLAHCWIGSLQINTNILSEQPLEQGSLRLIDTQHWRLNHTTWEPPSQKAVTSSSQCHSRPNGAALLHHVWSRTYDKSVPCCSRIWVCKLCQQFREWSRQSVFQHIQPELEKPPQFWMGR